jgi:hypothetical protein
MRECDVKRLELTLLLVQYSIISPFLGGGATRLKRTPASFFFVISNRESVVLLCTSIQRS